MKHIVAKYRAVFLQFIKFGVIGVSNTLLGLGVYYALVWPGMHYLLANLIGFTVGTLNSYYWNNKFVFQRSGGHLRTFFKMYAGYAFTFLSGAGLLTLQIEFLGISEYIAPLVNIPITTVINFLVNKFWVFENQKGDVRE